MKERMEKKKKDSTLRRERKRRERASMGQSTFSVV